jgi:hypothetical protein
MKSNTDFKICSFKFNLYRYIEVAPARALLAGAARLAGVEGAAGVLARGGVARLRPVLRLGGGCTS